MKIAIKMVRKPDGVYQAWCPALPGCEVFGLSRRESLEKIQRAITGYVAHLDMVLPRELKRIHLAN